MILEAVVPSLSLTVATTVVCSSSALLHSVILNPAAVSANITLYDNASAGSGIQLALIQGIGLATTIGSSVVFTPTAPIYCKNGITAVVTGTGAVAQVYFQKVQ